MTPRAEITQGQKKKGCERMDGRDGTKGKRESENNRAERAVAETKKKKEEGRWGRGNGLGPSRTVASYFYIYRSGNNGIPIMKWISLGNVGHRCTRQEILRAFGSGIYRSHVCPKAQTFGCPHSFVRSPGCLRYTRFRNINYRLSSRKRVTYDNATALYVMNLDPTHSQIVLQIFMLVSPTYLCNY